MPNVLRSRARGRPNKSISLKTNEINGTQDLFTDSAGTHAGRQLF